MFSLKKISLSYCLINFVLLTDNTLGLRQMLTNKQLRNRFPVTNGRLLLHLEPRVDGDHSKCQIFVSYTLETSRTDHTGEFLLQQNKRCNQPMQLNTFGTLQQTYTMQNKTTDDTNKFANGSRSMMVVELCSCFSNYAINFVNTYI